MAFDTQRGLSEMLTSRPSNSTLYWVGVDRGFHTKGVSKVAIHHQGRAFTPTCFVTDRVSVRRESESGFVMVLSMNFSRETYLEANYRRGGWFMLPVLETLAELVVYTDNCCLSNGRDEARAGYGLGFPPLLRDRAIASSLPFAEKPHKPAGRADGRNMCLDLHTPDALQAAPSEYPQTRRTRLKASTRGCLSGEPMRRRK